MKQIIKKSFQSLLLVPAIVLGVSLLVPAGTATAADSACPTDGGVSTGLTGGAACAKGAGQQANLFGSTGVFTTIVNVLLFIIGAVAVIMLIIGGIRYVVSGGDSGAVTSAKNTILYAVIGIIVAILAYAIVNFVLTSFTADGSAA